MPFGDFAPQNTSGNHRFDPNYKKGFRGPRRNLILWEAPHLGSDRFIEMYLNPEGITFSNKKTITQKRTKGGFIIQYWGEELEVVNLTGTVGDGGIEAINALEDVYRSEQLFMEEVANRVREQGETGLDVLKRRQPFAPLATSIIMWYMGQGKRGYFTDFQVDENVQRNGTFQYRFTFVVAETKGRRQNFMPWHRKPWSTSETPNVGGGEVVTGGYRGDTQRRIGRLSSESKHLEFVEREDAEGNPILVEQLVRNQLFDPKYWERDYPNPAEFGGQPDSTDPTLSQEELSQRNAQRKQAEEGQRALQEQSVEAAAVSDNPEEAPANPTASVPDRVNDSEAISLAANDSTTFEQEELEFTFIDAAGEERTFTETVQTPSTVETTFDIDVDEFAAEPIEDIDTAEQEAAFLPDFTPSQEVLDGAFLPNNRPRR